MRIDVVIPVYNGAEVIADTLSALLTLEGMAAGLQKIVVVDDGSTDATVQAVQAFDPAVVQLVRLDRRGGRSRACNIGVEKSLADAVLLLDADCRPSSPDLLIRHSQTLSKGFDLSFGTITAMGSSFWSRYARQVATERTARVEEGDYTALTSCNLAMRREDFQRAGGFCESYTRYGFEDRDLIVRLLHSGLRPHFDPQAVVLHEAGATVQGLCEKMEEAGCHTAGIFQRRHPAAYRRMRFARIDLRTAPLSVRVVARPAILSLPAVRRTAAWLVGQEWLSLRWRIRLVRFAVALAYVRGTAEASRGS